MCVINNLGQTVARYPSTIYGKGFRNIGQYFRLLIRIETSVYLWKKVI